MCVEAFYPCGAVCASVCVCTGLKATNLLVGSKLDLGGLRVRPQKQEGEVIRGEGRQQHRRGACEERLLPWEVVNVLHTTGTSVRT